MDNIEMIDLAVDKYAEIEAILDKCIADVKFQSPESFETKSKVFESASSAENGDQTSSLVVVTGEKMLPKCVFPHTSFSSQINSKPNDTNHRLKDSILISDSDDDLVMWVEPPTVIDLMSSDDESSNSPRTKTKLNDNSVNMKSRQGINNLQSDGRQDDPLDAIVQNEVNKSAIGSGSPDVSIDCTTKSPDYYSSTSPDHSTTLTDRSATLPDHSTAPDYPVSSTNFTVTLRKCADASTNRIVAQPNICVQSNSTARSKSIVERPTRYDNHQSKNSDSHNDKRDLSIRSGYSDIDRKNRYERKEERKSSSKFKRAPDNGSKREDEGHGTFEESSRERSVQSKRDEKPQSKHPNNATNGDTRRSRTHSRSPIRSSSRSASSSAGRNYRSGSGNNCSAERNKTSSFGPNSTRKTLPEIVHTDNEQMHQMNQRHHYGRPSESSSIDNDFTMGDSNEARIYLSKNHCRFLLSTESGYHFLNDAFQRHGVRLRMEWERFNNILIVGGTQADQTMFNDTLMAFVERASDSNGFETNLPKSKEGLINKLEEQFALLRQPLGNVDKLFSLMKQNEFQRTKGSIKKANRLRKELNTILMGQAGLRDGRIHVNALKAIHKRLLEQDDNTITREFFDQIGYHFNYVFSKYKHYNYPALIGEYKRQTFVKSKNLAEKPIESAQNEFISSSVEAESSSKNEEPVERETIVRESNHVVAVQRKSSEMKTLSLPKE